MIAFVLGHGLELFRVFRPCHVEKIKHAAGELGVRLCGPGIRLLRWRLALCLCCGADCNNQQNTRIAAESSVHCPAFHCWHVRPKGREPKLEELAGKVLMPSAGKSTSFSVAKAGGTVYTTSKVPIVCGKVEGTRSALPQSSNAFDFGDYPALSNENCVTCIGWQG